MADNFENREVKFVQRFLARGMTFLDVGAHHGLYTLLASKCVGRAGSVIAFEPSLRERRWLVRHVRLNFCPNVRVEPFAVGSERSQAELYVVEGWQNWGNSLRPPEVEAPTHQRLVDVITLDDYLAEAQITRVDFVKLDVEGAEREVLKGAKRLLNESPRPVVLAEVYDIRTKPWGYRAHEIVKYLSELNYEWFQLLGDASISRVSPNLEVYDANLLAVPNERIADVASFVVGC